jgi:hypothetical protein
MDLNSISIQLKYYFSEQPPLFSCKAHLFQVDPDTRKSWIPLSSGAGN